MERIGDLAKNSLARNSSPERPASDFERSDHVWAALSEMFGRQLVDQFGASPPRLWCEAIGKLTDDQVRKGLARLADEGRKFPPNLSEFLESCKRTERQTDTTQPRITGPVNLPPLTRLALDRIESGVPRFRGVTINPYAIPGRDDENLMDWLKSSAPEPVKDYCRELVKWTKANPRLSFPGADKLIAEMQR